ncbi:MAG: methyl-accepting chemotaxis protein [Terracidiphilus sp.]|jgi:methyl-accepting chemotaxis protein
MKLAVGFGSLLLVLVIVGVAGYWSLNQVAALSKDSRNKVASVVIWHDVKAQISEQNAELHAFLFDNTRREELDRYAENSRALEADFSAIGPYITTEKGKAMVAQFHSELGNYRSVMDQVIALAQAGKNSDAAALLNNQESAVLRDKYTKSLAALSSRGAQLSEAAGNAQQAAEIRAKIEVAIFVLLGVVIGIVMTAYISRNITGRVAEMLVTMRTIAENDLSVEDLVIRDNDEIGQAGGILNQMKNNLRRMIHGVAENAEQVASAAIELAASSQQLSEHADAQRMQSQQVAAAIHEMSAAIEEVSSNASKAAQEAQEARRQAHQGGEVVTQTVTAMGTLEQTSRATSQEIEGLAHSSTEIGKVLSVISEIAEQTNLLALNAAIEAARAGEQGRGFAVVAGEVRRLAERTGLATKEIGGMITTIQVEAQKAVNSITAEIAHVNESSAAASRAGSALTGIIKSSENVKDQISQIATAATEQAAATEEVNRTMADIARLIDLSTAGTQDSAKASAELSRLAGELQNLVGQFRLESRGPALPDRKAALLKHVKWSPVAS